MTIRIKGLNLLEIIQAMTMQMKDIFVYFTRLLFLISEPIQITVAILQQTAGITLRITTPFSTTFAMLNIAFTSNSREITQNSVLET
jgi:hypothetical protein